MTYRQLTPAERYMLARLRRQGLNQSEIARLLGRHRSTVSRELGRNSTRADGRRSRSRRNQRFTPEEFALVDELHGSAPDQPRDYLPPRLAG